MQSSFTSDIGQGLLKLFILGTNIGRSRSSNVTHVPEAGD